MRALRRVAALHLEFQASFGSAAKAAQYLATANAVTVSVQGLWIDKPQDATNWERDGEHFATNARHSDDCSKSVADDGVWVDDQLWAVVNGVASPAQARSIKAWLLNRTVQYESQPTRWSSKGGNLPPVTKQRVTETWYHLRPSNIRTTVLISEHLVMTWFPPTMVRVLESLDLDIDATEQVRSARPR